MNKIFNYVYASIIGIAAFGMTSCGEDNVDYVPAEPISGAQVYFPSSNVASINLSSTETSFDLNIARANTENAQDVTINVTDESGLYDIPSSVSFAAGAAETVITVNYDPEEVGFDNFTNLVFAIADASNTTPYGMSEYTVKVGIPSPWTSLGMATYTDAWMFMDSYKVELQQNDLDKNLFRLVRPYREGLEAEDYGGVTGEEQEYPGFRLLQPGEVWEDITITMEGLVAFNDISTEWSHPSYGETVWLLHPSRFPSMADENLWTYNKVLSYQENGLPAVVQLAPYYYMFGLGGWNYTQASEMVTIVFPGVVILDTSVEVAYTGMFTSTNDEIYAVAEVTLGEDVESAKVALVPSSEADAAFDGIVDGSIESVEINASGEVKIAIPADAAEGRYAIVAVTYANGEAQKAGQTTFKYTPANAETWTEIGVGDYKYADIFFEGDDPGLTLYKSDSNANRYKIEHWGYDVDFKFTYNEETGEIKVDDQETGFVHPDYGMIYIMDYADYKPSDGISSYYKDGTFYFAVFYYDADGAWGADYETFTLSSEATNVSARALGCMNKSVKESKVHKFRWNHMYPQFAPVIK